MELIYIILFGLIFAVLAWFRPYLALFVIAACLPSYIIRFKVGFVPMTLLELMVLVLFLVMLIKNQIAWQKIFQSKFFWPIVTVLFAAIIAVLVSPSKVGALGIYKAYFIEPILMFTIVISLITTRKRFEGLIWGLGFSALALSLFSLWQRFTAIGVPMPYLNGDGSVDRVVGIFGYPNALGLFFGPIIILYLGFLAIKKSSEQIFLTSAFVPFGSFLKSLIKLGLKKMSISGDSLLLF